MRRQRAPRIDCDWRDAIRGALFNPLMRGAIEMTPYTPAFIRTLGLLVLLALFAVGCTAPVYTHKVITKYDATGKVIGSEEEESLSQTTAFGSPFKVRITQRDKLEK
jgi:hypothetical protein